MLIITLIYVTGIIFCGILLLRNKKVCAYRGKMLDKVSELSKIDILMNLPWKWRYDYLDKVDYNTMLFKFWIPLHKFYEGNKALIETKEEYPPNLN